VLADGLAARRVDDQAQARALCERAAQHLADVHHQIPARLLGVGDANVEAALAERFAGVADLSALLAIKWRAVGDESDLPTAIHEVEDGALPFGAGIAQKRRGAMVAANLLPDLVDGFFRPTRKRRPLALLGHRGFVTGGVD